MEPRAWMRGEKGLQALEWIALALVALALLAALAFGLKANRGRAGGGPLHRRERLVPLPHRAEGLPSDKRRLLGRLSVWPGGGTVCFKGPARGRIRRICWACCRGWR
jgi:hypothetical protein